ncbi:unnamed protein product [Linum trigynum]|uniref:Uncharacterized protein n=1 Tax=Linum trigynum TaxID=586398 RepID=A0AAV2G7L1_9ROSI
MLSYFVHFTLNSNDISASIRSWPWKTSGSPKDWCTNVLLHATCWCIWLKRNARIFREEGEVTRVAFFKVCRMIFNWLLAASKVGRTKGESWMQIVRNRLLPGPMSNVINENKALS